MKRSDLYREWARVLDMCEGTGVDPLLCWNRKGYVRNVACNPVFNEDPDSYLFPVAIVEGKPVFVGDDIYAKNNGYKFNWVDPNSIMQVNCFGLLKPEDVWTWTKPKRTFTLNGEELPCPVQPPADWGLLIGSTMHYFKSEDDYTQIRNAINKILNEAL